jgi:manganese/zinc/iron transport system ATP- binding protein
MSELLLKARHVNVRYDRTLALDDVSIDLMAGTLTALVGPNGAGKSSLLQAIMGLIDASGDIAVCGESGRSARKNIAYVPQKGSVDWDFPITVEGVVAQGLYGELGLLGRINAAMKRRIDDALEMTSIDNLRNRQISELSGGQRQRVFLSRALVQKARVYLMDEPFAGVDAATERAIVDVLDMIRSQNHAILVVHHDLSTVTEYFREVVLLNQRVIASGPTTSVFTRKNLEETYGGRISILDHRSLADHGETSVSTSIHSEGNQYQAGEER